MADNDKIPKKDDPTPENPKDTRFQKKFPKKIIPDSQPSSDTDEERMEMWKNLQQQLQMERELNRMQFEELRTTLRTRHENPLMSECIRNCSSSIERGDILAKR